MGKISTLLVANRGEIAVRVMRTAQVLGMQTVAVYSDADADAVHVRFADRAVRIGLAPAMDSYLRGDVVIEAALASGADAIHPGYGFLSENAEFAQAVADAGLIFVGPPVNAIDVMGDKARSKRAMIEAGVPCVPGYQGEDQSDEKLIAEAKGVGFPLMVKAAAGGGGRGMRLVATAAGLSDAISMARSEAINAFGSGELILERAIQRPRHVEFQVFADSHGTVIHLGERDCSVQRRHQKVIEEAPCPVMTPELRDMMGQAAVAAARAVDYVGAGTVEFLLDAAGDFYFLEMNTRLQVEHPVTEMVTGLDLVALQLRVAEGEPLGLVQDDVEINGHAIEARLYAEDPAADFAPSTGPVVLWAPAEGEGMRIDSGIATGGEVSPYYDAMVAKVIACGADREQARTRLVAALGETAFLGPTSNREFLIDVLGQDVFVDGGATTGFISDVYGDEGYAAEAIGFDDVSVAAVLQYVRRVKRSCAASLGIPDELVNWSNADHRSAVVDYGVTALPGGLSVEAQRADQYAVRHGKSEANIALISVDGEGFRMTVDGVSVAGWFAEEGDAVHVSTSSKSYRVEDFADRSASAASGAGDGDVRAPMHGVLAELRVKQGDRVRVGDAVAVLEAMKMQHVIAAEVDGVVASVSDGVGGQIGRGDLIATIEQEQT